MDPNALPSARITCSARPREQRGACWRQRAEALQHQWLASLAWGNGTLSASEAARIQLWLGVFPVSWQQLPDAALLTAMVRDPALQLSLNGPANHRRNPNENLARELLELFSLGEGRYSERDVREAARALTGYRLMAERQLELDPRRHDPVPKTILGRTAAFDGESLATWLAEQPATARHITTRLWLRRVGTPPPPQRLAPAAGPRPAVDRQRRLPARAPARPGRLRHPRRSGRWPRPRSRRAGGSPGRLRRWTGASA